MRYAKIRSMDVSNGEGIGISLFVQGCHFHCKGCFNSETWDFSGGNEWTYDIEDKFVELANKPYINRISILGGEPLCDENVYSIYRLLQRLKATYPDKSIWLYTGYDADDIMSYKEPPVDSTKATPNGIDACAVFRKGCVRSADIVVDGRFDIDKKDLFNEKIVWAGSTNQRVLDVKSFIKKFSEEESE